MHLTHTGKNFTQLPSKIYTDIAKLQAWLFLGKFLAEQVQRTCPPPTCCPSLVFQLLVCLPKDSHKHDPHLLLSLKYKQPHCFCPKFVSKGLAQLPTLIRDLVLVHLVCIMLFFHSFAFPTSSAFIRCLLKLISEEMG